MNRTSIFSRFKEEKEIRNRQQIGAAAGTEVCRNTLAVQPSRHGKRVRAHSAQFFCPGAQARGSFRAAPPDKIRILRAAQKRQQRFHTRVVRRFAFRKRPPERRQRNLCGRFKAADRLLPRAIQRAAVRLYKSGTAEALAVSGLFVALGRLPDTELLAGLAGRDEIGYVFTDGQMAVSGTPGLFVAGDCRHKNVRQLTTAVSDGTVAAVSACEYLEARG